MIEFEAGILGFEDHKAFILKPYGDDSPFFLLQSVHDPNVGFVVVNPWLVRRDYAPEIWPEDALKLGAVGDAVTKLEVWVILTLSIDPARITVNLAGPIVINPQTRRGRQIVQSNSAYQVRHVVHDELRRSAQLARVESSSRLRMSG